MAAAVGALGVICPAHADVERLYVGVFAPGSGEIEFRSPRSRARFLEEAFQLVFDGFRLNDVELFQSEGGQRFVGLWRKGAGDNFIEGPMPTIAFRDVRRDRLLEGQRLADFEVSTEGGERHTGVWRNGAGEERISGPLEIDAFIARGEAFGADGLRLDDFEVQISGGTHLFRGLWHTGDGANTFVGPRSLTSFRSEMTRLREAGQVLVDVELIETVGDPLYAGVFRSGSGPNTLASPRGFQSFANLVRLQAEFGRDLIDVEVITRTVAVPNPVDVDDGPLNTEPIPLPPWVEFTDAPHVVVDFTANADPGFTVTLPLEFLKDLPRIGGEIAIPDEMCGVIVQKPLRFDWTENGQPVSPVDPLFNTVPENDDNEPGNEVAEAIGETLWRQGISFTAPVGPCASDPQWFFPFPFTGSDQGFTAPDREMVLTIRLAGESTLLFADKSKPKAKPIDWDKLFKDVNFREKVDKIVKVFKVSKDENDTGICDIVGYLEKTCESNPGSIDCRHAIEVVEFANC